MTAASGDPRPARSRARLLDAATALLRAGGPGAVTIDAVTRQANVARATLYRHFPSANDLVAAAFMSLIPPPPMPPDSGTLRERLIAVVGEWAASIAEAPTTLTAMAWLSLGPDIAAVPSAGQGGAQVRSLRSGSPNGIRHPSTRSSTARRPPSSSGRWTGPPRSLC